MSFRRRISREYSWPDEASLSATFTHVDHTVICRHGDPTRMLYSIVNGVLDLTQPFDGADVHVALATPGYLLGAYSAVGGMMSSVTATAVGPVTVQQIRVEDFHRLRETVPLVSTWLQDLFAEELHGQMRRSTAYAAGDSGARLERLILDFILTVGERRTNGSWRIPLDISVTRAAEMVFVSRQHASTLFSRWNEEGAVVREHGWLVVPQASALIAKLDADRA